MTPWRLVSDVGGSNVRFARSTGGHRLETGHSYQLKDFPSFNAALSSYLAETGGVAGCIGAAIGVAGPVDGDHVALTNADWVIRAREVEPLIGGRTAKLVNDLEAVAPALPHLREEELAPIGEVSRRPEPSRMLALNVGTGFGAASIVPIPGGWFPCPGEPGHMTLSAVDAEELKLIGDARCVESLLSGRGVSRIYARLAGSETPTFTGADIFARVETDPVAAETVRRFSLLLGRVAGDLTVAMAAWGGVYLCGSVVAGWARAGGAAFFREPFEDKGAMTSRMRDVYSGVILRDDIALVGLSYLSLGEGPSGS
jgi:glucokinase